MRIGNTSASGDASYNEKLIGPGQSSRRTATFRRKEAGLGFRPGFAAIASYKSRKTDHTLDFVVFLALRACLTFHCVCGRSGRSRSGLVHFKSTIQMGPTHESMFDYSWSCRSSVVVALLLGVGISFNDVIKKYCDSYTGPSRCGASWPDITVSARATIASSFA